MAIFDSDDEALKVPEPDASDYAQSVMKLGLAAVVVYHPHVAPLLVAWDQFSGILFNRRVASFFESALTKIRERGKSSESLFSNDQFVSALVQAIQTSAKTHQEEKLEALRNAVLNVALGHEAETDRQHQFLALIDAFSETHLILLRFFKDPAAYFQRAGKPVPMIQSSQKLLAYRLLCDAMPKLPEQLSSPTKDRTASSFQMIDSILDDLVSRKLIILERLQETWAIPKFDMNRTPSPVKPMATHLGEDFLLFITEPADPR